MYILNKMVLYYNHFTSAVMCDNIPREIFIWKFELQNSEERKF